MSEWVDLLDSANQKFDGASGGMVSTDAQAGILEANTLEDSEFQSYAVFNLVAATATVDFAGGNKQVIADATGLAVTVAAPAGKAANYTLKIGNSDAMTSIAPAAGGSIDWGSGGEPSWAGTSIVTFFFDGTLWYGMSFVGGA